ncbi:TonB-dependent receptor, partial [Pseudomonas aeruginosa]
RPHWPHTPLARARLIVSGQTLGADGRPSEVPSQVITANPLGNETPATPSCVLEGDELSLRQKGSVGETLKGLPGV